MISPKLLLAALGIVLLPTFAAAGPIWGACIRSDRQAASPQLCSCIDRVGEQSLSRRDQRQAAVFFRNPDQAQRVRMHKSPAANDFWARYKASVAQAQAYCG